MSLCLSDSFLKNKILSLLCSKPFGGSPFHTVGNLDFCLAYKALWVPAVTQIPYSTVIPVFPSVLLIIYLYCCALCLTCVKHVPSCPGTYLYALVSSTWNVLPLGSPKPWSVSSLRPLQKWHLLSVSFPHCPHSVTVSPYLVFLHSI